MQVSRSTQPLTNHSWQDWRFIYNNHIDVQIFPIMIWVHKEQVMLKNAQSHNTNVQGKTCLWQNTMMSIKLFGFSTFYVSLDFWHKSKKKLIKSNNVKKFKANVNKNKHNFTKQANISTKSAQPSKVTKHMKY